MQGLQQDLRQRVGLEAIETTSAMGMHPHPATADLVAWDAANPGISHAVYRLVRIKYWGMLSQPSQLTLQAALEMQPEPNIALLHKDSGLIIGLVLRSKALDSSEDLKKPVLTWNS